jgi:hypothetical protein
MRVWLGAVVLLACPQLLDGDFEPFGLAPDASTPAAGAAGRSSGPPAGSGGTASEPVPDASSPDETFVARTELGELLAHRYRFEGSGDGVADSVGNADGNLVGSAPGAVQSNGRVTLSGDDYVDLPDGIISRLQSVTIEAWVTWSANPTSQNSDWQILFSFGTNSQGEGNQGSGTTYLALTPKASDSGDIRASYTLTGYDNEVYADGESYIPTTPGTQVVMVVDGSAGRLSVYVDGSLAGAQSGLTINLSAIDDENNWIGRSQFSVDPNFVGDVLDFRIYARALNAAQVALSHDLGADAEL